MQLPPFHLHWDVLAILGGVWALYLMLASGHAAAYPGEDATWGRRARLFSWGMAVLFVGATWPVHDLAERYLYSMHMLQHMLFTLVAAPLLVAGAQPWMLRRLLAPRPVRSVFRLVTRPLGALVLYNGVLLFTHWPQIVEASVGSEPTHLALHVLIVASALAMWWPVVSPLTEMPPLSPPGQMMYLFFQSLAPTIPASFLTFGHTLLYPIYGTFPRIWGIDAMTDQLLAGLQMKLVSGLLLWVVIAVIFFRWHGREDREGWDALAHRDVERQLRAEGARS